MPVRFPELSIAYLEAGAGWIPYFLQRMDEEYEKRGHAEAKLLTQAPTEIVHRHSIYFSCEADEPLLRRPWPTWATTASCTPPTSRTGITAIRKSVKELSDRADLGDPVKRQVLAGNARKFYKL